MSQVREPPYPPPPRQAPAELGLVPAASAAVRIAALAAHSIGIVLFVAAPFLAAYAAYLCLQATSWLIAFRALGFIVFLCLTLVYLKSLLPRRLPIPPAVIPLHPDDQPTLYAFAARVANDVGARPPRRLLLGSGVELRLDGKRSVLDLVRSGNWDLQIGLWLWSGITLSELQALMAQALAPLARGRLERIRFTVRCLLTALSEGVDSLDELGAGLQSALSSLARFASTIHSIAVAPLRGLGRLLLRVGPREADFFTDDLAAVRIAGSDALVHAVLRSDFAGATLREIDEALLLAARDGVFTRDLYAHVGDAATILREAHNDFTLGEPPFLRGPSAGKHADVFEPGQRYLSNIWRGHPGPSQREHNAKRSFVAAERDERPALDVLEDPARLREKLTILRYVERYGVDDEFLALPAPTVRLWLATRGEDVFPAKYSGCYDGGRRIQPGTLAERESALAADEWDDARLLSTAAGLYVQAGDRAHRWRGARTALDRLLRRTLYRPSGRERAFALDLEEDLRKSARWLAALDRWVYVVHVHMAARLPDLALHDELLHRYESVLRIQPFGADAREYRNRVGTFAVRLERAGGMPPYRLARDADREFDAARKDFIALLAEAEAVDDPLVREWTGPVRLDRFLYAREEPPSRGSRTADDFGRRLLMAWNEVTGKALWLHRLGVTALLALHERILTEFTALAESRAPILLTLAEPPPIPDAIIVLEPEPELQEPEIVDEPPPPPPEQPPDAWTSDE